MKFYLCILLSVVSFNARAGGYKNSFLGCEFDLSLVPPARRAKIAKLFKHDEITAKGYIGLSRRELIDLVQLGRVRDSKMRIEIPVHGATDDDDAQGAAAQRASTKVIVDLIHTRLSGEPHEVHKYKDELIDQLILELRPSHRFRGSFSPSMEDLARALSRIKLDLDEPHIIDGGLDEDLQAWLNMGDDHQRLLRQQRLRILTTMLGRGWRMSVREKIFTQRRLLKLFAHLPCRGGAVAGIRPELLNNQKIRSGMVALTRLELSDLLFLEPNGEEELEILKTVSEATPTP